MHNKLRRMLRRPFRVTPPIFDVTPPVFDVTIDQIMLRFFFIYFLFLYLNIFRQGIKTMH